MKRQVNGNIVKSYSTVYYPDLMYMIQNGIGKFKNSARYLAIHLVDNLLSIDMKCWVSDLSLFDSFFGATSRIIFDPFLTERVSAPTRHKFYAVYNP